MIQVKENISMEQKSRFKSNHLSLMQILPITIVNRILSILCYKRYITYFYDIGSYDTNISV